MSVIESRDNHISVVTIATARLTAKPGSLILCNKKKQTKKPQQKQAKKTFRYQTQFKYPPEIFSEHHFFKKPLYFRFQAVYMKTRRFFETRQFTSGQSVKTQT